MANLYFRYGAMGAGKTIEVLKTAHNYKERGMNAIILKPQIENRDGENIIRSRIGAYSECRSVESFLLSNEYKCKNDIKCIIVDEAQFLTKEQVEDLSFIVDYYHIPIICYGLKTDFKGDLFEGSKALIEIADKLEEIPTICWCGKKARFNARICNGKFVKYGDVIQMGGNESYTSLCRKHFYQEKLGETKNEI